jgi:hypothetical protein
MKVICVRLLNADNLEVESMPWLSLGRVYHVMSIYIESNGARSYRIISNDVDAGFATMGYHFAECFKIISDVIPSNWKVRVCNMSDIDISPEAWQAPNFFEDFYDANPAAYLVFQRERDFILSEDPDKG